MNEKQFNEMMMDVVGEHFRPSALAYGEVCKEVTHAIFSGQFEAYEASHEPIEAANPFGAAEAAAVAGALVSVLDIAKYAHEAYKVIQLKKGAKGQDHYKVLESQLAVSLAEHLESGKAKSIAATISKRLADIEA